mmetsp:Transcript_28531/g.62045  ORF Transcript_28531/g.62045 Transcript_28531/m.62045 type:complete len:251 (+) Transcript_28531:1642-2394(+)
MVADSKGKLLVWPALAWKSSHSVEVPRTSLRQTCNEAEIVPDGIGHRLPDASPRLPTIGPQIDDPRVGIVGPINLFLLFGVGVHLHTVRGVTVHIVWVPTLNRLLMFQRHCSGCGSTGTGSRQARGCSGVVILDLRVLCSLLTADQAQSMPLGRVVLQQGTVGADLSIFDGSLFHQLSFRLRLPCTLLTARHNSWRTNNNSSSSSSSSSRRRLGVAALLLKSLSHGSSSSFHGEFMGVFSHGSGNLCRSS